eukprot:CAMPEP_0119554076 /NCGR_PEP_ID=MMETSP1352-20130426/6660_1 /TAXON_ID=265584 /ORGANISM="Stauroneis constricta, Strain CCMP1120" /LENGTH=53 /DNA_ID=CAMNT_0007600597 /DNA_START=221 /DNA_END=378 /DNA_ORIENTATION=+
MTTMTTNTSTRSFDHHDGSDEALDYLSVPNPPSPGHGHGPSASFDSMNSSISS